MLLYRYIVKEHIFPFLASLGIIVFLFIMQQMIFMLDRIVSKNIDPLVVLEVFLIQLGWILALGIPMAILTSTLMTFGRMSGDNEITAIKASGRSMASLTVPVMSAAAVLMVMLFFFHDRVLPEANHRASNLLGDISRKRPAAFIEPGVLIKDFPNYTLYTEQVNPITGDLRGVRIFADDPTQDPSVTVAETGNIRVTGDGEFIELSLYDGETHTVSRKTGAGDYFIARFRKQAFHLKNIDTRLERTTSDSRGDREMDITKLAQNVRQLKEANRAITLAYNNVLDSIGVFIARMDSTTPAAKADSAAAAIGEDGKKSAGADSADTVSAAFMAWSMNFGGGARAAISNIRNDGSYVHRVISVKKSNETQIAQYMGEVHKKFAIPVACVLFVLIGAPLGIMARRGGLAVGASYSVFFFVIYWVCLIGGENLGDNLVIPPALGMWAGNLFLAVCGTILMMLMMRETSISFAFVKNFFGKGAPVLARISRMWIFKAPGILLRLPKMLLKFSCGRLPAYLIGMFAGYALGLLAALVVIFVTIDYISNLTRFENASYRQTALYYYYLLPWITQTVLPIVLFMASMFSMGRLAKTSELTAMKAAGANVRQLTMPLLFLGLLLSAGVFYSGEKIIPQANEQRRLLRGNFSKEAAAEQTPKTVREYRRNFFYFGAPDVMYVFGEFCTQPQFFRKVSRYTFTANGLAERVDAATALYDSDSGWSFSEGRTLVFSGGAMSASKFQSLPDTILNAVPMDMVKKLKSVEEMSYWELTGFIEAAKRRGEKVQRFMAELEFKIALPLMNFIVILFGLSLAARAGRRGGAALFGVGLLLSFFYWMLSRFALVFAQNGYIPTTIGAWIGNVIFLIIGLALYRKAAH